MFGISAALTVPFTPDFSIDLERMERHAKTVLQEGCASVTLFGTTGEGPSIGMRQRLDALACLVKAGVPAGQIVLGLHGNAVDEVIAQILEAEALGVNRFLLPPAGYFKGVSDEGLFAWFEKILNGVRHKPVEVIVYHIPQVVGVGLSIDLVRRLKTAFPAQILGVKDSSGVWENSKALLELEGLQILIGDERQLARAAALGASGSISGLANLIPAVLDKMLRLGESDSAVNELVEAVVALPVTPAVKALVSVKYQDSEWRRAAPPLEALEEGEFAKLTNFYQNRFSN